MSRTTPPAPLVSVAAEDPIKKMHSTLERLRAQTNDEVSDMVRTADALALTWDRVSAQNTRKLKAVSEAQAAIVVTPKP